MRKLATLATACLLALILALPAGADARGSRSKSGGKSSVAVRSYVRKDGTLVRGHRRSASDRNKYNNWSTKGNMNPYTGKVGTENP